MALYQYLKYVYIKYFIHILAILDVYIIVPNTEEHIIAHTYYCFNVCRSHHISLNILF